MKILITYPPISSEKGVPLLSQNRQFQYFKEPTYIYPVVPAHAATMLSRAGFEVLWKDCIAENCSDDEFNSFVKSKQPDLIVIETKTPVVKKHWQIVNRLKTIAPAAKSVLVGDHVTALPEESFEHSRVDYVLTGGDYDFLLLNLCSYLAGKTQKLEEGIYFRQSGAVVNTGKFKLDHDLGDLPAIERALTQWALYAYKNGNFKSTPGTYIMSGRDCWWGKCTFCSWPSLYPKFRVRPARNVLSEIGGLIDTYRIKEIMDDTGSFPVGDWLQEFCKGMIAAGYNKKISFDCNMRFGALSSKEYALMKDAGFRLLLFGIESANQRTLDRINKNLTVEQIIESCKAARLAGLYPHITIMFGYPWESYEDAQKTLALGRWLLKKGYAYTVQATVVIPYPGTKLFEECGKDNNLRTFNWDDYDMKQPVMKVTYSQEALLSLVRGIYNIAYNPEFILRRLFSIRGKGDIDYFVRGFRKVVGHLFDFQHQHN